MMKRHGLAITQAIIVLCLCSLLVFQSLPQSFISEGLSGVHDAVSSYHDSPSSSPALVASLQPTSGQNTPSTEPNSAGSSASIDETLTVSEEHELPKILSDDPGPASAADGDQAVPFNTSVYTQAIMNPENTDLPRLSCPIIQTDRYDYLRPFSTLEITQPEYLFALDLHQSASLLPRLIGSIVETIRFLGPERCVLSVVEGRSTDGTLEILQAIRQEIESMGVKYFFSTNDLDPKAGEGVDRIAALAELRNQALAPLYVHPEEFHPDTTVLFINDVALCMEDILELIHQRIYQHADMTCAMDWVYGGAYFYDVWISRGMNGDQFFEIPQTGGWDYAENLFWNDAPTRSRLDHGQPFQVFSCWNGATAFTAAPLMQQKIKFRSARPEECYLGEPTHFCKDLWKLGHEKIAVVPSVNLGYDDAEATMIKNRRGRVSAWIEKEAANENLINWSEKAPGQIKCVPTYERPSWVAWDQ